MRRAPASTQLASPPLLRVKCSSTPAPASVMRSIRIERHPPASISCLDCGAAPGRGNEAQGHGALAGGAPQQDRLGGEVAGGREAQQRAARAHGQGPGNVGRHCKVIQQSILTCHCRRHLVVAQHAPKGSRVCNLLRFIKGKTHRDLHWRGLKVGCGMQMQMQVCACVCDYSKLTPAHKAAGSALHALLLCPMHCTTSPKASGERVREAPLQ